MKKYPHTTQEGIKDCGAASLSMVIKYYGGNISLEELRDLTKTTKSGTTAYHIIQAANNIGFKASGIRCDLNDITSNILPAIAFTTINNSYNHFIVIYEINYNKKYLIVADPKDKIKKILFADFKKIFNNVLITLYPIKKIPINTVNKSKYKFIIKILKSQKNLLRKLFILSIVVTFLSILSSFYIEFMLNSMNSIDLKKSLITTFIIFFSINVIRVISDFFRNKVLVYINNNIDYSLTMDTFKKIILLPYQYYKNRTTGEMLSRINDLSIVNEIISKATICAYVDLPLTIISIIFLYRINIVLSLITITIFGLYMLIIIIFRSAFNNCISNIHESKSDYTSYMVESISGFETVKGIHKEKHIIESFKFKYSSYLKNILKFQNKYFLQSFFKELVNIVGFLIITFIGFIFVSQNKMTIGNLLTFNAIIVYFLEPVRNIVDLDSSIKEAKNSIKRIMQIDVKNEEEGTVNREIKGDILIKNLIYSYNDRNAVLDGINLKIKRNEKVIVVGKSGSGKSTLFKLLLKYYKLENDKIYLDNIDINKCNLSMINSNIIYISQNETLFTDTVYNNVVLNNNIDIKKLQYFSKLLYVDDILDNNLGFNTLIEENGFNLSGGEKQRIVLLRTVLNKFNILIIDEGLNQTDNELERKILKNLFNIFKNKTIIFISHRLDNMDLFGRIIKLENGSIINKKRKDWFNGIK